MGSQMKTTPRCQKTVGYAKESLARLGQARVSSAHLVVGLLVLGDGVATNVLRKFGLSTEAAESYLSARGNALEDSSVDQMPFSESAQAALQRAEEEAQNREHTYVGTEHLLLGILSEEQGEATDLFASLNVDTGRMRQMVAQEINVSSQ
jgi:ATP-dependent Clp protease ATP-binding subunit ClpC